jgi:allantoinase
MSGYDLVIRAPAAVLADGVRACAAAVRDGRITAILDPGEPAAAAEVIDLEADEILLPGLVDSHVHVNEPGRSDWEGFASATQAAAAGGITTVIDMPLNSIPPTVDVPALRAKHAAARGQCHIDVGFWGGAVPGNLGRLQELHDAGVFGFKAFLLDSGVAEFPPLNGAQLVSAMKEIASFGGLLIVHAEDAAVIDAAPRPAGRSYRVFATSRPATAERAAVEQVIAAAGAAGARAHIVHLATGTALEALSAARAAGVPVSAETCPHYLALSAEEIPDGATEFKCCPPIRDAAERDALWAGLAQGIIGSIASDHSPCPPALKHFGAGDFAAAWGGIASLQLLLPVIWTHARQRGFDLTAVCRWLASGPADLAGLRSKGRIEVGADADLVAFAPDERFAVDPAALRHRHRHTPYAGRELTGAVRRVWLRGRPAASGRGRLLARGEA